MTDRTIVDILRKGNQELFHSAMVAWLLDPAAEHGYERGSSTPSPASSRRGATRGS